VWNDLLLHWDEPFEAADSEALAQKASAMFDHSYTSYLAHGFPSDNVTPKTCKPEDVQVCTAADAVVVRRRLALSTRPCRYLGAREHNRQAVTSATGLSDVLRVLPR